MAGIIIEGRGGRENPNELEVKKCIVKGSGSFVPPDKDEKKPNSN